MQPSIDTRSQTLDCSPTCVVSRQCYSLVERSQQFEEYILQRSRLWLLDCRILRRLIGFGWIRGSQTIWRRFLSWRWQFDLLCNRCINLTLTSACYWSSRSERMRMRMTIIPLRVSLSWLRLRLRRTWFQFNLWFQLAFRQTWSRRVKRRWIKGSWSIRIWLMASIARILISILSIPKLQGESWLMQMEAEEFKGQLSVF